MQNWDDNNDYQGDYEDNSEQSSEAAPTETHYAQPELAPAPVDHHQSNEDFVRQAYHDLLGREADDGGAGYWAGVLNNGGSRDDVVNAFQNSDEYKALHAAVVASTPEPEPQPQQLELWQAHDIQPEHASTAPVHVAISEPDAYVPQQPAAYVPQPAPFVPEATPHATESHPAQPYVNQWGNPTVDLNAYEAQISQVDATPYQKMYNQYETLLQQQEALNVNSFETFQHYENLVKEKGADSADAQSLKSYMDQVNAASSAVNASVAAIETDIMSAYQTKEAEATNLFQQYQSVVQAHGANSAEAQASYTSYQVARDTASAGVINQMVQKYHEQHAWDNGDPSPQRSQGQSTGSGIMEDLMIGMGLASMSSSIFQEMTTEYQAPRSVGHYADPSEGQSSARDAQIRDQNYINQIITQFSDQPVTTPAPQPVVQAQTPPQGGVEQPPDLLPGTYMTPSGQVLNIGEQYNDGGNGGWAGVAGGGFFDGMNSSDSPSMFGAGSNYMNNSYDYTAGGDFNITQYQDANNEGQGPIDGPVVQVPQAASAPATSDHDSAVVTSPVDVPSSDDFQPIDDNAGDFGSQPTVPYFGEPRNIGGMPSASDISNAIDSAAMAPADHIWTVQEMVAADPTLLQPSTPYIGQPHVMGEQPIHINVAPAIEIVPGAEQILNPRYDNLSTEPLAPVGVTVHSGDSIDKIAAQHGTSTASILALNPQLAAHPNQLAVGQEIMVQPWSNYDRTNDDSKSFGQIISEARARGETSVSYNGQTYATVTQDQINKAAAPVIAALAGNLSAEGKDAVSTTVKNQITADAYARTAQGAAPGNIVVVTNTTVNLGVSEANVQASFDRNNSGLDAMIKNATNGTDALLTDALKVPTAPTKAENFANSIAGQPGGTLLGNIVKAGAGFMNVTETWGAKAGEYLASNSVHQIATDAIDALIPKGNSGPIGNPMGDSDGYSVDNSGQPAPTMSYQDQMANVGNAFVNGGVKVVDALVIHPIVEGAKAGYALATENLSQDEAIGNAGKFVGGVLTVAPIAVGVVKAVGAGAELANGVRAVSGISEVATVDAAAGRAGGTIGRIENGVDGIYGADGQLIKAGNYVDVPGGSVPRIEGGHVEIPGGSVPRIEIPEGNFPRLSYEQPGQPMPIVLHVDDVLPEHVPAPSSPVEAPYGVIPESAAPTIDIRQTVETIRDQYLDDVLTPAQYSERAQAMAREYGLPESAVETLGRLDEFSLDNVLTNQPEKLFEMIASPNPEVSAYGQHLLANIDTLGDAKFSIAIERAEGYASLPAADGPLVSLNHGSGGVGDIYKGSIEGREVIIKADRDPRMTIDSEIEVLKGLEEYGGPELVGRVRVVDPATGVWREGVAMEPIKGDDLLTVLQDLRAGREPSVQITDAHLAALDRLESQLAANGRHLGETNLGDFMVTADPNRPIVPLDMMVMDGVKPNGGMTGTMGGGEGFRPVRDYLEEARNLSHPPAAPLEAGKAELPGGNVSRIEGGSMEIPETHVPAPHAATPAATLPDDLDWEAWIRGDVKAPMETAPAIHGDPHFISSSPTIPTIGDEACGARAVRMNNELAGLDVQPLSGGYTRMDFERSFGVGSVTDHMTQESVISQIAKAKEGDSFIIGINPKNPGEVAHAINAQVVEGRVVFRDPGLDGKYVSNDLGMFTAGQPENYTFYTVDGTSAAPKAAVNQTFNLNTTPAEVLNREAQLSAIDDILADFKPPQATAPSQAPHAVIPEDWNSAPASAPANPANVIPENWNSAPAVMEANQVAASADVIPFPTMDMTPPKLMEAPQLYEAQNALTNSSVIRQAIPDHVESTVSMQAFDGTGKASGDFVGVYNGPVQGEVHILVGDVMGHGDRAARSSVELQQIMAAPENQAVLAREGLVGLDRVLSESSTNSVNSAMSHLVLNAETGTLRATSVGDTSVLISHVDGAITEVPRSGHSIGDGALEEVPAVRPTVVALRPHDQVYVVTDGIVDRFQSGGVFGLQGIRNAIAQARAQGLSVEQTVARLQDHPRPVGVDADDSTAFAFHWRPPGKIAR